MLTEDSTLERRLSELDGEATSDVDQRQPAVPPVQRGPARRSRRDPARALAFVAGAALIVLYALRSGSDDVVVFESYGIVVWWLLATGVAFGLLPRSRPSRAVLVLLGLLLAYAAWTAASLTWTESSERTMIEVARSLDYLGLAALIAFALDGRTWRAASNGVGFGALLVSVLAVASRLVPSAFGNAAAAAALHTDRLSYPLGYWNAVAAWGAIATAIGLALSAHEKSRRTRAVMLALVPFSCAATYLSYSRAGVAGTALAVIAVVALSRNRLTAAIHALLVAVGTAVTILAIRGAPEIAHATGSAGSAGVIAALLFGAGLCAGGAVATAALRIDRRTLPRPLGRGLAALALVGILLPAAVFGPRLASRAWHSFTHPVSAQSADPTARLMNLSGSRYYVWKSALNAFEAHPATGTGAGTFAFWWNRHAADYEFLHDAHNIWLQNLAELGAPGLLLIAAVVLAALGVGIFVRLRTRRRSSTGAAVAFLAALIVYLLHASVDWMWESTAVTVLAISGIAAIAPRLGGQPRRLAWWARGGLAVAAILACAVQVPSLLSTVEIRRSQAAVRQGNEPLALAWAADAVGAEPWSASAYDQRALVREAAGQYVAAAQDLRRAISHEPTNYVHWLLLARVQTESGEIAAAARDYRQAHSLRPLSAAFVYAPYFKTR